MRTTGIGLPLAPLSVPTPAPSLYYTVTPVDARGRLAAEVLDFDPAWLGRRLAELGCQSTRERVTGEDGRTRQIRGYRTTDLITAAAALRDCDTSESSDGER